MGDEFLDRFRTDHYSEAWLRIRSEVKESSWPDEPVDVADLLVIDEAHHVTRTGRLTLSGSTATNGCSVPERSGR